MRLFLANIQRVTGALASNDLVLASKVAAIAGAKNNENDPSRPPTLRSRQPDAWNQYIGKVRKGFDELSSTATTAPIPDSLSKLSAVTQNCVACHQTFRIID
jgi:cytochrome c556